MLVVIICECVYVEINIDRRQNEKQKTRRWIALQQKTKNAYCGERNELKIRKLQVKAW